MGQNEQKALKLMGVSAEKEGLPKILEGGSKNIFYRLQKCLNSASKIKSSTMFIKTTSMFI